MLRSVFAASASGRQPRLVSARSTLTSGGPDVEPASRVPGESAALVLASILLVGRVPIVGDEFDRASFVVLGAVGQAADPQSSPFDGGIEIDRCGSARGMPRRE